MKAVNIIPTTTLNEYRNILVSELESTTGECAKALSKASINRNEVTVYAKIGNKTYKGYFKVLDKTLTVNGYGFYLKSF